MKKLLYNTSLAILGMILATVLSSCSEDYLNVSPIGSVTQETSENEEGVRRLLNGAYNLLNECGTTGGGYSASRNRLGTIVSDEAYLGTTGTSSYEHFNFSPTQGAFNSAWSFNYSAIQRANEVLRVLNQAEDNISENVAQQYRAEARFLRGLYHLRVKLLFGNIPYIDETISYNNGNYNVSNDSLAWPKIEEDFQYASENLNETKADPGRANSWAAKAYLAKTYMFQAKFNEAQPLLSDIINNGVTSSGEPYDLYEQYQWNFDYAHRNGPGSVFAVQPSVQPSTSLAGNCGAPGNGPYGGSASAWGWTQPSHDFANRFQTDEDNGLPLIETYHETPIKTSLGVPSSESFTPYQGTLDPRIDWSLTRRGIPLLDRGINPGQAWIRNHVRGGGTFSTMKHISWAANPENQNGQYYNYPLKLIRFADVLLWAAEVEVEIGSLSKAQMYVNRVRERAANPDGFVKKYQDPSQPQAGFSDEPAANYVIGLYPDGHFESEGQDWAREAVRFERVLELGLEHHRYFDLKRYDLVNDGYMANTLNTFIDRTAQVPVLNKPLFENGNFEKGKNERYPIPQRQIDLSVDPETGEPKLIQNPGYQ